MINLSQLQEYMRKQSEEDKRNKTIKVTAANVQEALKRASVELGVPVKRLEYEVTQKGSAGALGLAKKPWTLSVYEKSKEIIAPEISRESDILAALEGAGPKLQRAEEVPGEVFVRISSGGAFVKVTKPKGKAPRATEIMALEKLSIRGIANFEPALVAKAVKHADGEYVRVADVQYNPANDATVSIDITDGEMKAVVVMTEPGPGGADLTVEYLKSYLNSNGVVYGIKDEVIAELQDSPHYGKPIMVAEGTKERDGNDAEITYYFKRDEKDAVKLKEKDGRVDFKDISTIENVVAGQLLARKIPAEPGETGQTVTGKAILAQKGKDCELIVGKNVKLSEDGMAALAEINGQVLLLAGKINVEPIYTISGDVNLHTGNVLFLGTVIVKGNVEDGFSVKAAGNIEIFGSVGKCVLDAEGDIVVHQGIAAKTEGRVRCGKSLYSKFIEHARVEAGENVVVTDGIIHSQVDANRMILCQGKRAQIVGGKLRASEEINSKILGSVAGTESVLEVGYDPKSKERLAQLDVSKKALEKSLEEVELNIKTLENLQKVQHKLAPEKAQYLLEENEKRSQMLAQLEEVSREMGQINSYLISLTTIGKISASERVYPGVRITIKNATLAVRTEFKFVTFYLQAGDVKVTKYEAFDESLMKRK
jgi:uncharacterized protein (DUF342 family)